eukprot:1189876-Prorocentrum_minimum.AAC.4
MACAGSCHPHIIRVILTTASHRDQRVSCAPSMPLKACDLSIFGHCCLSMAVLIGIILRRGAASLQLVEPTNQSSPAIYPYQREVIGSPRRCLWVPTLRASFQDFGVRPRIARLLPDVQSSAFAHEAHVRQRLKHLPSHLHLCMLPRSLLAHLFVAGLPVRSLAGLPAIQRPRALRTLGEPTRGILGFEAASRGAGRVPDPARAHGHRGIFVPLRNGRRPTRLELPLEDRDQLRGRRAARARDEVAEHLSPQVFSPASLRHGRHGHHAHVSAHHLQEGLCEPERRRPLFELGPCQGFRSWPILPEQCSHRRREDEVNTHVAGPVLFLLIGHEVGAIVVQTEIVVHECHRA